MLTTPRASVSSIGGMVATSQVNAAQAGVKILEAGGNAADAAVAAAAALAVTEPSSCGIGGDCFVLYFDASENAITALNGSGRSPLALSLDRLSDVGITKLDSFSAHTVTVPGAVAAWLDLLERHGTKNRSDVFEPAIELADRGFAVGQITAHFWQIGAAVQLSRWPSNPTDLFPNGRGPVAGEVFRNPNMARCLDEIADGGKDAFYRGRIAREICQAVRAAGGFLDTDDLAAHHSEWVDPISTVYPGADRSARIWECPPNGQGLTALVALNTVAALGDRARGHWSEAKRLHHEIEAMRLAFADANTFIADPSAVEIPLDGLLSPAYAAARAKRIAGDRASVDVRAGSPEAFSDTVYLAVVDAAGNACSLIFSNYMGFGSGIVPSECGFPLQNRGHNFSLERGHRNALAPGKRPFHTIIPALATDPSDGSLLACFGVMGGFMQPQGHLQVVRGLFDDAEDPQTVLERPRWRVDPRGSGGTIALEEGFPAACHERLSALGHKTRQVSGWQRSAFGRGQIIMRKDGTTLIGGSDPRADGIALASKSAG